MKILFTYVLLLVFASIIVTTYGQVSNTSPSKINNLKSLDVKPDVNKQSELTNEDIDIFPETGKNSVNADIKDEPKTNISNNMPGYSPQPSAAKNASNINEDQVIPVVNENNKYLKNDNLQPKEIVNEYKEISTIEQPVNFSGNAAKSSHGVPFFIIFLFAFFIPPVGVALMFGITDKFWICLLLTLCFWLPGMIYAMIQIFD